MRVVCVYGPPGVGKTWAINQRFPFANTPLSNVAVIQVEDQTDEEVMRAVNNTGGADIVIVESLFSIPAIPENIRINGPDDYDAFYDLF